jgi:phosphoribosylformimino-5-aminoimidazole carboxamide ribotide isomerase
VLIPSIDLMGGKIVQLIQGEKKALEFDNFEEWITRFSVFPLVQLIDLDAAMGSGENAALAGRFLRALPCQFGGGIRSIEAARAVLKAGARRVILGSVLIQNGGINICAAREFAEELGSDKLVCAIDTRGEQVAIRGWKESTEVTATQMIAALDSFCGAFLYTHIDSEGLMTGLPLDPVRKLRKATDKQLIVAGGIATHQEILSLHRMQVDAVVGMALYSGLLKLPDSIPVAK